MRNPGLVSLKKLLANDYYNYAALVKKGCYPPRPPRSKGFIKRVKLSWLVFSGRADVISWE